MREVSNVEAVYSTNTPSKILSSTVLEVASTSSSNVLATFADDFNNGETEAVRVVNISFISSQLKRFEELFPKVVPIIGQ